MPMGHLVGTAMLIAVAVPAFSGAQTQRVEERNITLVGCVMTEAEYRDRYGPGRSGPRGPGIGLRNEYMLVAAREAAPGTVAPAAGATCPPAAGQGADAYELTGPRERELEEYVGQFVELSGIQKAATARPDAQTGTLRPTGGFNPLGHELHLFEIEVERFVQPGPAFAEAEAAPPPPAPQPEPPPAVAEAPAPPIAPEPQPEPERQAQAQPAPQFDTPAATPAEREVPQMAQALPRTASPLPLAGLLGLLALVGAGVVRSMRRHH